jgi:hypothetical protein
VKRSTRISLVLLGGLSAGALTACAPDEGKAASGISAENVYTNDTYIPGAGYYHAPFRAFFPFRYNHYDPAKRQYFFGGRWSSEPHRSVINISMPTPEAAAAAEAARDAQITRGGFGGTSHHHSIWS